MNEKSATNRRILPDCAVPTVVPGLVAMVSAPPLCNSVHDWVNSDRIRMCGISEERKTSFAEEDTTQTATQLTIKECCSNTSPLQVNSNQMSNEDREEGNKEDGTSLAMLENMVGRCPIDSTSSELTDVRPAVSMGLSNQTSNSVQDTPSEVVVCDDSRYTQCIVSNIQDKALSSNISSAKRALSEKGEESKLTSDCITAIPGQQWPAGPMNCLNLPMSPCFSATGSAKRASLPLKQAQPLVNLSTAFQCPSLFNQAQPMAFTPSTSCGSPFCKITLPVALGKTVGNSKEANSSQLVPEQNLQNINVGTITKLSTNHFNFSLSRTLSAESKSSCISEKCTAASGLPSVIKSSNIATVLCTPAVSVTAPLSLSLPTKQPQAASSPQPSLPLASHSSVCLSVTNTHSLSTLTAHPKIHSEKEKSSLHICTEKPPLTYVQMKCPPSLEEQPVVTPLEVRDIPLDLSAKSKRQKVAKDLRKTPPMPVLTPMEASKNDLSSLKRLPSTQAGNLGFTSPFIIFPDSVRNGGVHPKKSGDQLSCQPKEAPASWIKTPLHSSVGTVLGTYVGVANPVLASTLQTKDGKGGFVEDLHSVAKQETISIIDQKEQKTLLSGVKSTQHFSNNLQQNCMSKKPSSDHSSGNGLGSTQETFPLLVTVPTTLYSHCKLGTSKTICPQSQSVLQQTIHIPLKCISSTQTNLVQGKLQDQLPTSMNEKQPVPDSELTDTLGLHLSVTENENKLESSLINLESVIKTRITDTPVSSSVGDYCQGNLSCQKSGGSGSKTVIHTTSNKVVPFDLRVEPCTPKHATCKTFAASHNKEGAVHNSEQNKLENVSGDMVKEVRGDHDLSNKFLIASKVSGFSRIGFNSKEVPFQECQSYPEPELCGKREDQNEFKGLSPCVKLEGITLAFLNGQCTTSAHVETKNGTKETGDALQEQKTQKIPKKRPKLKKASHSSESVRDKVMCTKSMKEENGKTCEVDHQKKKRRKRRVSAVKEAKNKQPVCQPPEDKRRKRRRRGIIPKTNGVSKKEEESNVLETSALINKEHPGENDNNTPRLGRGRRSTALKDPWTTPSSLRRISTHPRVAKGRLLTSESFYADEDTAGYESSEEIPRKKRRRRRNRKYQNGEYITDQEVQEEAEESIVCTRLSARTDFQTPTGSCRRNLPQLCKCPSPSPVHVSGNRCQTRLGSLRIRSESSSPQCGDLEHARNLLKDQTDKPAGKRKCKTKHLSDGVEEKKVKLKRGRSLKRTGTSFPSQDSSSAKKHQGSISLSSPKSTLSPHVGRRGGALGRNALDTPPGRPIPPEARRLIVNKNAGETLLQRAARLGYQEVVDYCLEKELCDVNHRDNAGYTALHEACARGWINIVKLLVEHGADVNCSAQDGTRPIHDAVANDNLNVVRILLSHGADPTLSTYSGQSAMKLANSPSMKSFLTEYFGDLEDRSEEDPKLRWDFHGSSVFETDKEMCWDFLLTPPSEEDETKRHEEDEDSDSFLFEFSEDPLLPSYNIQTSFSKGSCNWMLLSDVLKRLKVSARIFQARYPHLEVTSIAEAEFYKQTSLSQLVQPPKDLHLGGGDENRIVELVCCVPELLALLGSTFHRVKDDLDSSWDSDR
ncbi:BCL-6 corepressor-like protein 1 isoform X1 [Polypterus senegalus]|uniref:BCL-6 corepressor-like protein 1 isoform X1 n=2 Tax=Polypterus senegalus TaxID=55291 RepID=UPI001963261A|nr:BCL-6 corepressor-like protein 1 isoform X1 [Polypterus senegalus]